MVAELHRFERLLRETFASSARLAAAAAVAQEERGVSIMFGEKLYGLLASTSVDVSRAIATTSEAHRHLAAIGRKLGVDTRAYGDEHPKPNDNAGLWTGASGRDIDVAA